MIELNTIHNMPCVDMFAALDEQAALIVADPPYGISYKSGHTNGRQEGIALHRQGKIIERSRKDIEKFPDNVIDTSWIPYAFDALKDTGALYLFTRWDVLHHWHSALKEAGFSVVQRIVWDKKHWGMGDLRYFGSQTEDILFCVKNIHSLQWDHREGNVWRVFAQSTLELSDEGGYRHPTQKPSRLMSRMIQYSSKPNDLILDPFSGSGAACIAAQRLQRRFIGTDISPTFAAAANQWLADDRNASSQTRMNAMF